MNKNYVPKTEEELQDWMKENCYNFNDYSIKGNFIYEGFGIDRIDGLFVWYFTERGKRDNLQYFRSEEEVVKHAYNQIKSDDWARTHCIGFTSDKSKSDELHELLTKMEIKYIDDKIPYYGAGRPVFRTFVLGCDILKTEFLKEKYYTDR